MFYGINLILKYIYWTNCKKHLNFLIIFQKDFILNKINPFFSQFQCQKVLKNYAALCRFFSFFNSVFILTMIFFCLVKILTKIVNRAKLYLKFKTVECTRLTRGRITDPPLFSCFSTDSIVSL